MLVSKNRISENLLEKLKKHPCPGCRQPMGDHQIVRSDAVDPMMSYAVNPERVSRFP